MIGNYVRGPRHLIRSVEENKSLNLLLIKDGRVNECKAIVSKTKEGKDIVVFFQNLGGDRNYCNLIDEKFSNIFNENLAKLSYFYYIKTNRINHEDLLTLSSFYNKCIILPNGFNELYSDFLNSNKKLFSSIIRFINCNLIGEYLYSIIGDKPNLFLWAVSNLNKHNVSLVMIEHIIMWNENYSKQVNKLSKGTITAYNSRDAIFNLYEELTSIRANKRANDSMNMFNTNQKKALKSFSLTNRHIDILNKFGRLSFKKKINFIRKVSTIDSPDEILKQMLYLTNSQFEWSKESLVDYINNAENINANIIINNDNILLVKVNDYDTVKFLARTTNWCISKNKRYWDDYVGKRGKNINQYVLFDFSKDEDDNLSIVGFTVNDKKGITNAHDFTNENLMDNEPTIENIRTFYPKLKKNIDSILYENNIDISQLTTVNDLKYNWDRDSFVKFLYHCIDDSNFDILVNTDKKVIVKTKDCNISHIIGSGYDRVFCGDTMNYTIVLFADFSKKLNDRKRLIWCVISSNSKSHQESCGNIFDAKGFIIRGICFDRLLDENHLPYDSICRIYSQEKAIADAFMLYDIKQIDFLLRTMDMSKIKNINVKDNITIPNIVSDTICVYKTFDFIDVIYNNGYKLCDLSNYRNVLSSLRDVLSYADDDRTQISENDLELFNSGTLKDIRKVNLIGIILSFKKILSIEDNSELFKSIIEHIYDFSYVNQLRDYIIDRVTNMFIKLNNEGVKMNYKMFIRVLIEYKYNDKIELILNKCNNTTNIYKMLDEYKDDTSNIKKISEKIEEFILV